MPHPTRSKTLEEHRQEHGFLAGHVTAYETRLAALVDEKVVAFCDVRPDVTGGRLSPLLPGWG